MQCYFISFFTKVGVKSKYNTSIPFFQIYKDIKLRQDRRRQSMSQVTINHQARRRLEDNLAMVFMGIVGVFLVCHILRVSLNIHEMIVIEHAMACSKAHKRSFPMWAIITNFFRSVQNPVRVHGPPLEIRKNPR